MRKGNCIRTCGRCCTFKALFKSLSFLEKIIMFLIYLPKHKIFRFKKLLNFVCPHLKKRKDEFYCDNYINRPNFCRAYPATKKDLIDSCGYWFE